MLSGVYIHTIFHVLMLAGKRHDSDTCSRDMTQTHAVPKGAAHMLSGIYTNVMIRIADDMYLRWMDQSHVG